MAFSLAANPNPTAVAFVLSAKDIEVEPRWFVGNPNEEAFQVYLTWVRQNMDKVHWDWMFLSKNPCPSAVQFILELVQAQDPVKHRISIALSKLQFNPNPIILDFYYDWIQKGDNVKFAHWIGLSQNPTLFVEPHRLPLAKLWHEPSTHVIYRLPLELVRMIAECI